MQILAKERLKQPPEIHFSRPLELLILWALCLAALGCQRLQLPAIDPNGSCLFLPFPNTTQLAIPPVHSKPGQQGLIPAPAYKQPVAPPACLDGSCEPAGLCNLFSRKHDCLEKIHNHFRSSGKSGELQLTPMRVVAPVGGEVVLLAGICGEDGYLVKREPLEWMISPDSVGQIIEVNDDAPGKLSSLISPHRPKVEKLDVDFAKGRTSGKAQVIDRGTPDCNDDIHLREGETWLSVSSPTPGITRITALAPESKIWDRRRQTAVIYWLDAQWEFPPPQIVKADQRVLFRTKVTKAEGFVPATGWVVQYTIVDPAIATFVGPANAQRIDERTIRVPVDQDGFGYAELAAVPNNMGTTPVLIDVISPAQPAENIPELVVGRGQSFATFSAAGLQLQTYGPDRAIKGEQVTLTATLANAGDIDAENTRLILNLPQGLRFISASLQPTAVTDQGAVWDQGVLPANRQLDVTVLTEAVVPGTFEVIFQGEANGVNPARRTIRLDVIEPMVTVKFEPAGGVSQAEVGQIVPYEIQLTNSGPQTLTNLRLKVKSDPGLVEVSSGTTEVEQTISLLQPGETRRLGIPFRIQQEGQQRVLLQILSGNATVATTVAERTATILGLPPRPKQPQLGVDISFPLENPQARSLVVGQTYNALITLRNAGEVTLTNPDIEIRTDARVMEIIAVDQANLPAVDGSGGYVHWTPGNLLPGDQGDRIRQLKLAIRAIAPTASNIIEVVGRSNEGAQATASTQPFEIRDVSPANPQPQPTLPPVQPTFPPAGDSLNPPGGGQGPDNGGLNPGAAVSGKLAISLTAFNDPEQVGKDIRYGLTVTNQSDRENNRVQVELRIPEGAVVRGVSSQGTEVQRQFRAESLVLQPINFLRRGESVSYIVVLQSRIPQQLRIQAAVRSDLFPEPETAVYTSTITPAN
jgi:uncharacterized repeat protein (TIGR01451 family)